MLWLRPGHLVAIARRGFDCFEQVILVCHELEVLPPSCRQVVLLEAGRVAATGSTEAVFAYIAIFFKELRAIMFSRADAEAAGIRATAVWTGFLILTAATLTVNFQTVGGLMIYSLISNPAAAAFQVARGCRGVLLLSAVLGAASGLGGFLIAAATDLPSGAVIVLVSSALLLATTMIRRWHGSI